MCLVVLAWRVVPGYRLVLAGNRDELHARPSAPLAWWPEPRLLAGRDLVAGGTWLGADPAGRFGVVTNFRGGPQPPAPRSRGRLITDFLTGPAGARDYLEQLAAEPAAYAGFSLLVADRAELAYYSNRDGAAPRVLEPGFYGLSNASLDTPWPKLMRARQALGAYLTARSGRPPEPAALAALLAERSLAADAALPDTGIGLELERRLSAAFIVDPVYGTRCSSALLLTARAGSAYERSFDAVGTATGVRLVEFESAAGEA